MQFASRVVGGWTRNRRVEREDTFDRFTLKYIFDIIRQMQTNLDFLDGLFAENFISEYNHSNYTEEFDGTKFFHMDCSGFVHWCLTQMGYKRALVELRHFLKQNDFIKINRFFCKDFAFINKHKNELKYWQFIDKPVVGSIMVVVFPDGNGHCMFVDKIIKSDNNNTFLRVIDSTQYPHKNDTRTDTGIGIGEIEIIYEKDNSLYNSNNQSLPIRKADFYFVLPQK